jgi:PAS domain S-box-containing protein
MFQAVAHPGALLCRSIRLLLLLWVCSLLPSAAGAEPIHIGVLAFRPKPQTLAQWEPLTTVLNKAVPGQTFRVEALTYPELDVAVASGKVDFILTNPGHYVILKRRFGLTSPLATLATEEGGQRCSVFGGVIFVRSGQTGLATLGDLRGRTIALPSTESLGGYQMQAYELMCAGVVLPRDARLLPTGMPHDNVVEAVLSGRADAGFVRTGALEAMAGEGKLDLHRLRLLNPQSYPGFPALVSTRLYPEWPLVAMPAANEAIARQVAAALYLMKEDTAEARAMGIRGFAVPADYTAVEDLLRDLRLPPFEAAPGFTLPDVWQRYRWQLVAAGGALASILLLGLWLHRANVQLRAGHRALVASQELFAKAFATSPDAINITRLEDGVYIAVNEGFTKVSGYTAADVLGHSSVSDQTPLWVDPKDRERLVAGLKDHGEVTGLEARFRVKNGTWITGLMSAKILEIQGERHVISITRDISALRQAEAERATLQAQLQHAQKMESLGGLASGVAHDMNNVLGAILGLASANLEMHPVGSPTYQAFDTITRAATRGGKMVKTLLGFARQNPAEAKDLDLNALLREELRLMEATLLARVRVELDLAPGLRLMRGDAAALTNAFMNLCVNAVDAMPESGTLTLRTRNLASGWLEIQVEDTGCGMAKEVLAKALDPFFTTKVQGKGTGLGLAMVYGTVKAHQGQLELHSEPGQGTRVTLRFPACEPDTVVLPPPAPGPAAPPNRARAVLLVDDDELVQHATVALLEVLGHQVTLASSGEEALAQLDTGWLPDLVILDLNMPGLGGAGTLPRLRTLRPTLPVLLATGRADQTAMDLVAAHPGVTLLSKPFDLVELQHLLQGNLGS